MTDVEGQVPAGSAPPHPRGRRTATLAAAGIAVVALVVVAIALAGPKADPVVSTTDQRTAVRWAQDNPQMWTWMGSHWDEMTLMHEHWGDTAWMQTNLPDWGWMQGRWSTMVWMHEHWQGMAWMHTGMMGGLDPGGMMGG